MRRFTQTPYGQPMAVLQRQAPRLSLPPDFGLGIAVTAILGVLLAGIIMAAQASPGPGPRSEARPPEGNATYVEIAPPQSGPAVLPTP